MNPLQAILRFTQLCFVAVLLGLCGALLQQQVRGGTPTRLNYSMFAIVLAAFSLLYLIPATFINRIAHPVFTTFLDVINAIFLLCAGIALASSLGGHNCTDRPWLRFNTITNGGVRGSEKRCREADALTAFLWFASAAFAGSLVVGLVCDRAFPGRKQQLMGG
jgi:cytosine/uracil/thiamine/allantoin permease